jgi:hypothetical protein
MRALMIAQLKLIRTAPVLTNTIGVLQATDAIPRKADIRLRSNIRRCGANNGLSAAQHNCCNSLTLAAGRGANGTVRPRPVQLRLRPIQILVGSSTGTLAGLVHFFNLETEPDRGCHLVSRTRQTRRPDDKEPPAPHYGG